jgi:heptosyltransferase III
MRLIRGGMVRPNSIGALSVIYRKLFAAVGFVSCSPTSGGAPRSGRISRFFDYHAGRAILRCLGVVRRRPNSMPVRPKTIGLCTFGAIGDAVLTGAIIHDLKRRYPDAAIIMVVTTSNAGIIPLIPDAGESLILPIYSPRRAIALMRQRQFDLLIDANQWLRISAVYCALAGAGFTVGFRTPGQFRHYAFDMAVEHSGSQHELENFRGLLTAIGIAGTSQPRLQLPEVNDELLALTGVPFVVLHPWAGGRRATLKEWPLERWVTLGKTLVHEGYVLMVTGGPADVPKATALVDAARNSGVPMIMMAGCLNLGETGYLLRYSALVIAVNTGIMHMAAALDVPLVALHGPTNPDRWGPISGKAVSVVPGPVPPAVPFGYLNLGFETRKDASDCMIFIPVERVLAAVDTVMETGSGAKLPLKARRDAA